MNNKQIIHLFAPNVLAGAERVVITGLNALVDSGLSVHLFVIKEMRNPTHAEDFISLLSPKIKITVLNSYKALDLTLINELKIKLKSFNASETIIHTHGYKALLLLKLANKVSKYHIVHTHHGNTSHTLKVKLYEWIAMKIMNQVDAVICVSTAMKELLSNSVNSEKLVVIENMLSFKNAKMIQNERKLLIQNKSEDNLKELLFVGRLSPEKGALHFVKIFSNYVNREKYSLIFVGDGPEKNLIESEILSKNLTNVKLVGFQKDPSLYFIKADALIMPSFTEGLPMTLIEALSSGLPVMATNVGAISSLLINNKNGILLNDNSPLTWVEALDTFLNNQKDYQSFSSENALEIETRFSVNNWSKKTIELYRSILL